MTEAEDLYEDVERAMSRVLISNEDLIELLTVSVLTGGHVILEGVPGVAKTLIANLFARATGLEDNRIQMTPDILPADVTGTYVYREETGEFQLQRGPIFANVVLADEINRATPKTQSALLEAMEEHQVTIEGDTLSLPEPFMVIGTQNPIEMEGVFELPEAQRDRFQFKLTVDLPERNEERAILDQFNHDPDLEAKDVQQATTKQELRDVADAVKDVYVDERVRDYILDLVEATRESPRIEYGASPRASLTFLHASKARAAIHGRDYVIPDDVKRLAKPTLVHRLVLGTDLELSDVETETVVEDLLEQVPPPESGGDLELEGSPATPNGDVSGTSESE
jgi:MoxR-like ATPase